MLLLVFRVHASRYAIETRQMVEILPLVTLQDVPGAPRGVAGIFNYRGTPVPVIDLSDLLIGEPSGRRLSTRLIVANYPLASGGTRLLGLIAEHATETLRRSPDDAVPSGIVNDAAPYLGPVLPEPDGLVQLIDVSALLPPPVQRMLFVEDAGR